MSKIHQNSHVTTKHSTEDQLPESNTTTAIAATEATTEPIYRSNSLSDVSSFDDSNHSFDSSSFWDDIVSTTPYNHEETENSISDMSFNVYTSNDDGMSISVESALTDTPDSTHITNNDICHTPTQTLIEMSGRFHSTVF